MLERCKMKNRELALGIGFGFCTGVFAMSLFTMKILKDLGEIDRKQNAKNKMIFEHLIDDLGPYAPQEVLEKLRVDLQFEAMVIEEEGPK